MPRKLQRQIWICKKMAFFSVTALCMSVQQFDSGPAAVWELFSLQRGLLLHLMMFYQLFCGFFLPSIATLTLLSHTAINTQKPCLACTTLLALPSAVEHFQFIRCIYFLKCFPEERKINILRDSYDIFCPLCRFWSPYHKTYTIGRKILL